MWKMAKWSKLSFLNYILYPFEDKCLAYFDQWLLKGDFLSHKKYVRHVQLKATKDRQLCVNSGLKNGPKLML